MSGLFITGGMQATRENLAIPIWLNRDAIQKEVWEQKLYWDLWDNAQHFIIHKMMALS